MPTFEHVVYTDVDLDEFDDDDLIEELENRGYNVSKDPIVEESFFNVEWHVLRGELKEALILLERKISDLKGISDLV
jgi:hypothetical protein